VAAVITMVTLGKGVTVDIEEQISSLGSNVFFVFPIQTDRGQIRPFDERDVIAVREQIAGVKFVAGQVERNVTAIYNGQDWRTKVEGVENEFLDARGIEIDEGRRFTGRGNLRARTSASSARPCARRSSSPARARSASGCGSTTSRAR
jgi:putative ABC transport system permease protein